MFRKKKNSGFTLVEVAFSVGLAVALIILVMKMTSVIRGDVAKGTVDLQNLQEARVVLNFLRRDFACATPIYDVSEKRKIIDEVRADPIMFIDSFKKAQNSRPIIINSNQISFCKTSLDSADNPIVEFIDYIFDPVSKTLFRRSMLDKDNSSTKSFNGIEAIKFDVYYHPLKDEVPMLFVQMLLKTKEGNLTRELPLTTTISSSMVSQDVDNLDWNWEAK